MCGKRHALLGLVGAVREAGPLRDPQVELGELLSGTR